MRPVWSIVAALAMLPCSAHGQNLRDTLQWMTDTASHYSFRYHFDSQPKPGVLVISSELDTLLWSYGNPGPCDIKITIDSQSRARYGTDPETHSEDHIFLTFNLRDIDPNIETSGSRMAFQTRNELPKIACQTISAGMKSDTCYWSGPPDTFSFDFQSRSYTKRFTKALHHAVELCGGAPSPF
jgi:hypothetical protein